MDSHSSDLDPLSAVLQDLRLSGVGYGRCELTRPWGISFAPEGTARFHFVAEGECWLREPERGWLPLFAGDMALLPRGAGHALADVRQGETRPLGEIPLEAVGDRTYRMTEGGGGKRALLYCCSVAVDEPATHPLFELMPAALLLRAGSITDPTLPLLLGIMAEEVASQRVGAATVLNRLADVVIARVIRAWIESRQDDETTGWLAALRDPQIGRALAAIHRRPGDPLTVESLADIAQFSRSRFSERFTAVVGVPPARYIARWRMHVARRLLRQERLSIAEVAGRLGYDSEASFSRAFKRLVGVPPGDLRRRAPVYQS